MSEASKELVYGYVIILTQEVRWLLPCRCEFQNRQRFTGEKAEGENAQIASYNFLCHSLGDEDTWGSFAPVSYEYSTPFKEKERPSLKALTSYLRSMLALFYLLSSSFSSMRKECLFPQTSPQTSRHVKAGSCAKSWQYDLDSHSHGSVAIDFSRTRISSLLVSSLARITGMKLVLREEIRLLFYTNAQMSNVYEENRKDHKKD